MAIDPLATWQSTFAALPLVADDSWKANVSDWLDARIAGLALNGIGGPGLAFTFAKSSFQSALDPVDPALGNGAVVLAAAFETSVLGSSYATGTGSYIGSATPTTTWSVVNSTIVDAVSVAAGKAKVLELLSAPIVDAAIDSDFPVKMREAFLLLTISTSGLNSVVPPAGPNPLNDPFRAVQ